MSSQRKIEANRRNALKSTGPKTPAGKAAASRNAFRHGLRARPDDLATEEDQALAQVVRDIHRDFRPDGPRQTLLVRNLAVAIWRMAQFDRAETAIFEQALSGGSVAALETLGLRRSLAERALYRALHRLNRLRSSGTISGERSQLQVGEMAQPVEKKIVYRRLG